MRAIALGRIRLTDPFWKGWQDTVRSRGLPIQIEQCEQTGRIENFRRVARGEKGGHQGRYYNDSDVYKWIEAASAMRSALGPSPEDDARLAEVVQAVVSAQQPDGYINTYFCLEHPELRYRNLAAMHELYCMGHLIEAAVAHHEATGERTLLGCAVRLVDHLWREFGPEGRVGFCGHEELELALVRLADAVDEPRYRQLALRMVDQRGRRPSLFERELDDAEGQAVSPWMRRMLSKDGAYSGEYVQDQAPFVEQTVPVGHAVRAMYLYSAATDLLPEAPQHEQALRALWASLTQRRMYVTGGIGASPANEGFTDDYDLPNRTGYAETCAACGLVFWASRMRRTLGDAVFADVMETALYNGALAGISLSGERFFYDNPLESYGEHDRSAWFDCACCPPNIARLIASVGSYLASVGSDRIQIEVPASFQAQTTLGGVPTVVSVTSRYPWGGEIEVEVATEGSAAFEVALRVPGWSSVLGIEGAPEAVVADGFVVVRRAWADTLRFTVRLDMTPRRIYGAGPLREANGKVALARGPLVYALEEVDLGAPPTAFRVGHDASVGYEYRRDLLGGIGTLTAPGFVEISGNADLYGTTPPTSAAKTATLVPYHAWNNRGRGGMSVWLRT